MTAAVQVERLSYRFAARSQATLDDLSCTIEPGSWTLLTGRTGSGKSTLLRALCGLIPHHAAGEMLGTVALFGRDTRSTPPAQLASLVGLVLQSPDDQICTTTPAAEVAFGLENLCLPPSEIAARVAAGLDSVGLNRVGLNSAGLADAAALRTHQLSGGQKQRLVLAAVLAMRPRLLLLDEPLSQLDPQAAADLLAELDRQRAAGLTIVMVEHRLHDVLPRVDRVLALDGGRLRECGVRSAECGVANDNANQVSLRTPHSTLRASSPLLSAHQLSFRYPDQPAAVWDDLNFTLHAGERVALVGANGSGKSTLVAVLAGLVEPTSGRLEDSLATAGPSSDPTGGRGLVLQNPDLMLFCPTVFDELAFGPRQAGLTKDQVRERVDEAAASLSLGMLLNESPLALSQGQRLRTALAATLTLRPRLLLLDEPTTGQDQEHLQGILDTLVSDGHATPRCLVFSTHDLRFVAHAADRVLVLGNRCLLADCRPEALLANDALLAAARLGRKPLEFDAATKERGT